MQETINQKINRENLFQLLILRLIAIAGQVVTILVCNYILHIHLPLTPMFLVILVLALACVFDFYSYKSHNNISDKSLFIRLLFDVVALTVQLYLSGGISNPFISLFLLQVIIGAILLQAIYAWIIAALTIIFYVALSFNYRELNMMHHHGDGGGDFFNLHLHGMLISYVTAAILLLIFITRITKNLKLRDEKINLLKQQSLQKEQVIKMGLLATGAAHELGTPLSTIAVILSDLEKTNQDKSFYEDIKIAKTQIDRCKNIISQILSSSGKSRFVEAKKILLKTFFDQIIKEWKESRKPENLVYNFAVKEGEIIADDILAQAFFNIFDNALEASPAFVEIEISAQDDLMKVRVKDHGEGFNESVIEKIGQPNLSTKNSSGLGLFLVVNILQGMNGKLKINNSKDGAEVVITIPLKNL